MIFLQPLPQTSPSLWSPPPLFVFIFKQHKHNMMKSTLSCITRLLFSWMGKQTHRHIFMLCNLCSIHTAFWAVQILLHYFWRALVDTGQRAVFLLIFSALTLSRVLADFPALHFWRIHRPLSSDGYSACASTFELCVFLHSLPPQCFTMPQCFTVAKCGIFCTSVYVLQHSGFWKPKHVKQFDLSI